MVGLRERQKEQRGRRILEAASELVASRGNGITVEDIAARAEVSVGTVYNYFSSRSGLVMALFAQETELLLKEGQKIVASPPSDSVRAVSALLEGYPLGLASRYERGLLRELMSTLLRSSPMREMFELDIRQATQLTELLRKVRARGHLSPDIRPAEAAFILYSAATVEFMFYLFDDDRTSESLAKAIRRQVRFIFRGLSPR